MFACRPLLNQREFLDWVASAGVTDIAAPMMLHVTIAKCFSDRSQRQLPSNEDDLTVRAGHHRSVRNFGGVVVLVFNCRKLVRRHNEFRQLGMTWDHPLYQPHISFAVDSGIDLCTVKPFCGRLIFGPEHFEEISISN
ncbi:hypothetical protein SAMN05428983_4599 [Agrobacterium fabrum]|uniref:Anti-CBASS protein Acb1 n=1 Tax=Agrobacterium fabrum TaxID=1176649 RepID=A0A7Z7FRZ9_9HYPH|nr:hypothetical protein [Agrobacterium fabrum]SDK32981.1 hypothetical protein SAMN05428983_4599 [Agrobacterium fabrum]